MSIYDTYGFEESSLEEIQRELEKLLEIEFQLRYSSYMGNYSSYKGKHGEKYELLNNYSEEEGWVFDECKNLTVILRIDDSPIANDLRKLLFSKIDNVSFIKRAVIVKDNEKLITRTYRFVENKDKLISEKQIVNRKIVKSWHLDDENDN